MPQHARLKPQNSAKPQVKRTLTPQAETASAVPQIELSNPHTVVELQRYIGNKGVQRLLADQSANLGTTLPQIQREADHTQGCGCPACSGRIQRSDDEHDEDIAAKRIVQRTDEHDEDIAAKRIVQRMDEHESDIQAKRLIQREGEEATPKTVTERLAELSKKNLKRKFKTVFSEFDNIALSDLKPEIEAADASERKRVWKDGKLLSTMESKMSESDYLDLLPALGMFKKGRTAEDRKSHTSADKADKYIRKYLGDYVKEAAERGASVEGQVAVVDGSDWDKAYEAEFGDDGEQDSTNAFVDQAGRIWVHKNRGNAGTIIHEGVHKYAKDDFLSTVGFNFNEGITEYFTRKICDSLKYKRGNYQSNWKFATDFVGYLGEAEVAKAYFDGAVDDLKTSFTDKGKDWDVLIAHVKAEEWTEAKALCK
jgi:hypothetical protein